MPENIEIPIVHRAQQALRLLCFAEGEARVDRTDGVVERAQKIVRIIERAVRENIDLRGFQDAYALEALVELVDEADLFPEVLDRDAARDLEALRMIGNADVLVTLLLRRRH